MTRLSEPQKEAVIGDPIHAALGHQEPTLHRCGSMWACIWREPGQAPAGRWRGQLVKEVRVDSKLAEFGVTRLSVWWTGFEVFGKTRRAVVEQLDAEALR